MAVMRAGVLAAAAVALLAAGAHALDGEGTFMQFAYIRDATVDFESIFDIAEVPAACQSLTAAEAALDEACHRSAKRICDAMERCGGFVLEPRDAASAGAPGVVVKVYSRGAALLAMRGAVVFEYRGQVEGVSDEEDAVDEFLSQAVDHEQLAADIDAALKGDEGVTRLEAAIDAFVAAMDVGADLEEALTEEEVEAMIAELAEKKRAKIQQVADETMAKSYTHPVVNLHSSRGLPHLVPRVTCSAGELIAPARLIPGGIKFGRHPELELGVCTPKRLVSGITCSCTEREFVPVRAHRAGGRAPRWVGRRRLTSRPARARTAFVHARELHARRGRQLHPGDLHAAHLHAGHLQRRRRQQVRLLEPPVAVNKSGSRRRAGGGRAGRRRLARRRWCDSSISITMMAAAGPSRRASHRL